MLLVIDVGNTNVVFGIFEGKRLVGEWRVATHFQKTADEYGILLLDLLQQQAIKAARVKGAILSSVVPPLTPVLQEMTRKYFLLETMVVTPDLKTGLRIRYDNPKEVGADRIVNASAAYRLYGGPLIIVDFGTATTFCVISKEGDYLGGAIAPGLIISAEALFARASKLPRVELIKPKGVVGRDTVSSIQSGMIFGYVGLVNEIVHRIYQEIGRDALVVATGGLSTLIAPECSTIQKIRPTLTLEGLMFIYNMNS
ncbi:MAG: type III pantothenate kinase [Nitrospirae bacterium]|nr:type III pantothenate kinase [Candidatus Manganitrophaceae bacterium]